MMGSSSRNQQYILKQERTLEFEIPYGELQTLSTGDSHQTPPQFIDDLPMVMDVMKTEEGPGYRFGLRCDVPPSYKYVAITHRVKLRYADPDNHETDSNLIIDNSYNFDASWQYGPGPFNGGGGAHAYAGDIDDEYLINGNIVAMLVLRRITGEVAEDMLIRKIFEKVCHEKMAVELKALQTEVVELQARNKEVIESADPITQEIKATDEAIEVETKGKEEIDKKYAIIQEVNLKFRGQITGLKERLTILEKKVSVGNLQEFLKEFKPEDLDLADLSSVQLKSLLKRLMKLQKMIVQHIREQELCIFCVENRRSEALMPCGHLMYCQECSKNVMNKKNMTCSTCSSKVSTSVVIKF